MDFCCGERDWECVCVINGMAECKGHQTRRANGESERKRREWKEKKRSKKIKSTAQTAFCAKLLLDSSIQNETVQMLLRCLCHCHTVHIHTQSRRNRWGRAMEVTDFARIKQSTQDMPTNKLFIRFFFFSLFASLLYTHTLFFSFFFVLCSNPNKLMAVLRSDLVKFLCVPLLCSH